MNKNRIYIIIIILFLVALIFSYILWYYPAIIDNFRSYIIRCGDFWQYLSEVQKYSKDGQFLINIVDVGKEPGLFLIESTFQRITWMIIPNTVIILESLIIQLLMILAFYVGIRNISKKKSIALLATTLITTAFLTNTLFTYLIARQVLANFFLLITFVFLENRSFHDKKWIFICWIFLANCFLAHRIGIMFGTLVLWSCLLYSIISRNKIWIKKYFFCLFLGIVLCLPYLTLEFWNIIYSLEWYSARNPYEWLLESSKWYISGWSFFTNQGSTDEVPIVHYLTYQSWVLILAVSFLKWMKSLIKKSLSLTLALLVIAGYVSLKLIFWVRILATLEIFLLLFIGYGYFCWYMNRKKFLIVWFFCFVMLWFISIIPKSIKDSRITNIQNDPSINFIKNNIPRNGTFLMGEYCVTDLASQLGYVGANNLVSAPVWKHKERELNWEIQYYTAIALSDILVSSVGVTPYLHNVFKDLDVYILFRQSVEKKEDIDKLLDGTHPYFTSPYLDTVYRDPLKKGRVLYIFHVKNNQINYFDTPNYAEKNLIDISTDNYYD